MFPFFIKEKYSIRHKILKALQEKLSKFESKQHLNQSEIELSLHELSSKTKLVEKKIIEQTDYLVSKEEINSEWDNRELNFCIIREGTISFFDKKYLEEGKKEFWNNNYDIIKTFSAVIILIIAVVTFIFNIVDTRKNKSDIEKMKIELNDIKAINKK